MVISETPDIAVGSPDKTGPGAVFIFKRNKNKWNQVAKISPGGISKSHMFGRNVSISDNFIFVSASGVHSIYQFKKLDSSAERSSIWKLTNKISGSGILSSDRFGSTSIAAYGRGLIVGADYHNDRDGAAYIFDIGEDSNSQLITNYKNKIIGKWHVKVLYKSKHRKYSVEFKENHEIKYPPHQKKMFGTWIFTNDMQIAFQNPYSSFKGIINGNIMTGNMKGLHGERAKWEAYKDEEASINLNEAKLLLNNDPRPVYLSVDEVRDMIQNNNFYDKHYNSSGIGVDNQFESVANGDVVYDSVTGLTWQKHSSLRGMTYDAVDHYIETLNSSSFGGYSDWRLPTLKEAMTLMETNPRQLRIARTTTSVRYGKKTTIHTIPSYIDPIFEIKKS